MYGLICQTCESAHACGIINEMPKSKTNKRKTQKLSKTRLKEKQRRVRFYWIVLVCVAFAVFFFNFVLTISGGWDDVDSIGLLFSAIASVVALAISGVNVLKFHAHNYELIAPLAVLGMSAMFYFAIPVIGATSVMAGI